MSTNAEKRRPDYLVELYVAGVLADAGWNVYFPHRDEGFDFIIPTVPILSLEHVQIAIPIASEDRARAFYSGILGFAEIAKPPQMAERKSIWFVAGAVNLHLGIELDFHPAKRAHPAFIPSKARDPFFLSLFACST